MHKMSLKLQSKNQVDSTDLESVLDASGLLNQQRDQAPETKKIESKRGRQVISQRTNSLLGVQIVSSGSYVPDNVVTNQDLQERFGFNNAREFWNVDMPHRKWPPVICATKRHRKRFVRHA